MPLCFGKSGKGVKVKALVCDQVPVGEILLAAEWLYEHKVTTTKNLPAIWLGNNKTMMVHAIIETQQLKASTTGTVDPIYLPQYAKLFS